jgi:uncharacterized protein
VKRLALAVLLSGTALAHAGNPSFDCDAAETSVEKAICAEENTGLALQDGALGRLYDVLKREGGHDALLAGQSAWLRKRNACGGDVDCLTRRYDERLQLLARAAGDTEGLTGRYHYQLDGDGTADGSNVGDALIILEAEGTLSGSIGTVSGPTFHICSIDFDGAISDGQAYVWSDPDPDAQQDGQSCQITFTPGRDSLRIDSQACQYYCGARGYFDADYAKLK